MPSGERIISTNTGDILGSRWGHPARASEPRGPTPPQHSQESNGGDIIGGRRAASPQKHHQPSEPIISTIDEGDIIGRTRWVPRIDRLESGSPLLLPSRHATPSAADSRATTTTVVAAAVSNGDGPTTVTTSTTNTTTSSSSYADLNKLKRLIDRLSWKSHTLLFTQQVALSSPLAASAAAAPTTMFKLDFFEYYTLLERILVLALAHFRVPLPKSAIGPSSSKTNGGGGGGGGGGWGHRYHESVLEAVERPGTAVSEVLGRGEVAGALRRAKGFRNRWKDADEQVVAAWECQREDILELRLEELVEVVLVALERLYRVAEERATGGGGGGNGENRTTPATQSGQEGTWGEVGHAYVDEDMEDAPWEAVGDAMEDVMDMDVE